MLLAYFLNDFEKAPVAPIITGITFVFTFHMRCLGIHVRSAFWVTFSPYFIHFLVIFCRMLPAIHIAPYHFSGIVEVLELQNSSNTPMIPAGSHYMCVIPEAVIESRCS